MSLCKKGIFWVSKVNHQLGREVQHLERIPCGQRVTDRWVQVGQPEAAEHSPPVATVLQEPARKRVSALSFPYVCPEPVLVK